ncbi:hypothetical protein H3V53_35945 [Paraburkholderia bengalensis]|uniref:Uncharacterized protein n=1 Tax=Paraburkholderia bengalensis TaxID=2747562 RepID=A0ABU8J3L2_9BURK
MISKATALAAAEASVLERMAASRASLVTARNAMQLRQIGASPSLVARAREYVSVAPNVTLLAAILVGSLVVGPRKITGVVVRNGLLAWIARTVRRLAGN